MQVVSGEGLYATSTFSVPVRHLPFRPSVVIGGIANETNYIYGYQVGPKSKWSFSPNACFKLTLTPQVPEMFIQTHAFAPENTYDGACTKIQAFYSPDVGL